MSGLLTVAALVLGGLVGGPPAMDPDQGDRSFHYGKTGRAAPFFYHQVSADCETITHGFGRNSAWGRWTLPVARIQLSSAVDGQVTASCIDGDPCIGVENLIESPARIARHEFVFETNEGAEGFAERIARLRTACAIDPDVSPAP